MEILEFALTELDTATTSSISVHALTKGCLQIKPGSGLYTLMEFYSWFEKSIFSQYFQVVQHAEYCYLGQLKTKI